MSSRPIFVATHPRACSTAFERVFMTRRDTINCVHEPFGDAFYYGPERLSERYENDEPARLKSGFSKATYKSVLDQLDKVAEGKRLFIKDMAYYLVRPDGQPTSIAPSLLGGKAITNGASTNGAGKRAVNGTSGATSNPTVLPENVLQGFHFAFLIRHPRRAIPSYFRCTVPPLDKVTGFSQFLQSEAGYKELRLLFDYLKNSGVVGHAQSGEPNGVGDHVRITVIDADDLLDNPEKVVEAFCQDVGLEYSPDMLRWGDQESQEHARQAFQKWDGFHNDVLASTYLKPRAHGVKTVSIESEDEEWRQKYGNDAQKVIRECVNANIPHYEYLKSFALEL